MRVSNLFSTLLLVGAAAAGRSVSGSSPHPAFQPTQQRPLQGTVGEKENSLPDKHDLKHVIDQSPLLSFHRDLIEIESISGNEAAVGDLIVRYLQARDFTVEKQVLGSSRNGPPTDAEQKSPPRFNIYAYPKSSPAPPKVLLTSHIDTVPPYIPYGLDLPADRSHASNWRDHILISGRGSVDAKASVAAQVFAVLEYLQQTDAAASLGLLFVVGEEVSGDGMQWFARSDLNPSPPTMHTVIFGEPTDLALVSGHKGTLFFTIWGWGKAAHSGYPWLGRSAVSAILPALARIDRLGDIPEEDGGLPGSEKLGQTTVNIGRLEGGVAGNVVPVSAWASVNLRLAHPDVSLAKDLIVQAVREATHRDEHVTIEWGNGGRGNAPIEFDTDVDGFAVKSVNYGTDAFYLKLHDGAGGSPHGRVHRYLYGPGSIFVAHGADEAIPVGQLETAVEGYKTLIDAAFARNQ